MSYNTEKDIDKSYFRDNLRNWTMQTDYECPPQISALHLILNHLMIDAENKN